MTELNQSTEKSRYLSAPKRPDFTLDQDWGSYSAAEHDRWDRLFARAQTVLKGRACNEFLAALNTLQLSESGIPDLEKLSARLTPLTGWQVVPVAELVPDEIFFDHLANRRFPAGAFIRPEHEMDYLQEPDIFHDVFGHVPLLANPVYADFMEAYGKGGQRAMALGQLKNLARSILVHGGVRTDEQRGRVAHLRRRHSVVSNRVGLRPGRRLAEPDHVRPRTRDADELHHRRFPAELFRH